jgi:hypothetical protein
MPLLTLIIKYIQERSFDSSFYTTSDDVDRTSNESMNKKRVPWLRKFVFHFMSSLLPTIVRPVGYGPTILESTIPISSPQANNDVSTASLSTVTSNPMIPGNVRPFQMSETNSVHTAESQAHSAHANTASRTVSALSSAASSVINIDRLLADKRSRKTLFDKEIFTVSFIVDMAVLMTFGTIFPPLGYVIFMNMLVNTFLTQMWIGRFVYLAKQISTDLIAKSLLPLVDFLNEECKDVGQLIFNSIPTIAILATVFWAFALFDTLGDSVGTLQALWIFLLMGLMPAWVYLIERLCGCCKRFYQGIWIDANGAADSPLHVSCQ